MSAGEIADALGLKANTLSGYLKTLLNAGLILRSRDGTTLSYSIDAEGAGGLVSGLFMQCCNGRPDLCPDIAPASLHKTSTDSALTLLFLCTANSARSIIAEAMARKIGAGAWSVFSAGHAPAHAPHPLALRVLDEVQISAETMGSTRLDDLPPALAPDAVITLCDRQANEACTPFPNAPLHSHWQMTDPVAGNGSDEGQIETFRHIRDTLHRRLTALKSASPEMGWRADRLALQTTLDQLATF